MKFSRDAKRNTGHLNFAFAFNNSEILLTLIDCLQFLNFVIWHVYTVNNMSNYFFRFLDKQPNVLTEVF